MNTVEALAFVIAEQRDQINQLENDSDIYERKAQRYEMQFNMANDVIVEIQEALRLSTAECAQLKSELLSYQREE